jgi:hypothetical protein
MDSCYITVMLPQVSRLAWDWSRRRLPVLVAWWLAVPASLYAQTDYRNLDDDRPSFIEDAYPVERFGFEFMAPWRFEKTSDGFKTHLLLPELAWGVLANAQVGIKVPMGAAWQGGDPGWGVAGLRAFALYNFTTEGRSYPGLSLRADASFPVGGLGGEATRVGLKAIATRSFGAQRLHLNLAASAGSDSTPPVGEGLAQWSAGAAVDRTFFRESLLLIGEFYALEHQVSEPTQVIASIGVRWQLWPTLVVDGGVARRLSQTGPDLAVTLGLSHPFGVSWLMPRPRQPR